jgi:hypothetical protein
MEVPPLLVGGAERHSNDDQNFGDTMSARSITQALIDMHQRQHNCGVDAKPGTTGLTHAMRSPALRHRGSGGERVTPATWVTLALSPEWFRMNAYRDSCCSTHLPRRTCCTGQRHPLRWSTVGPNHASIPNIQLPPLTLHLPVHTLNEHFEMGAQR